MYDFEHGINGLLYRVDEEHSEPVRYNDLTTVKNIDIEEPGPKENGDQDIIAIPRCEGFSISYKMTHKQARQWLKYWNAVFYSSRRRIRTWYRTKERLRRARLKGKDYIVISPRINGWLQYHQSNEGEKHYAQTEND